MCSFTPGLRGFLLLHSPAGLLPKRLRAVSAVSHVGAGSASDLRFCHDDAFNESLIQVLSMILT
jgi:hypothetical protein